METRTQVNEDDFLSDYPEDVSRRQTNALQKYSKVAYSYAVDGVALPVIIAGEFIPGIISQPWKEAMKAGLIVASIGVTDVMRALSDRKHPFTGLSCFAPLKYIIATAMPLGVGVGLGFAIKYLDMGDTADNVFNVTGIGNSTDPLDQTVSLLLHNPLVHMGALAFVSYAQFGLTKMLIEYCEKPANTNEEGGRHFLQIPLKMAIDALEPIAMYEALRMIMLQIGQDAVLHHQFFPLIVVGFDQLLKCWGHMSRIPKPLENLVPEDRRFQEQDIDEVINSGGVFKSEPSCSSIAQYSGYYTLRALVAVTAGGLVALEVTNYLRAESDQEKLDSRDRLLNLLVMTGATGVVEQVFDLSVQAGGFVWSRLSGCRQTLFGSSDYHAVPTSLNDEAEPRLKR